MEQAGRALHMQECRQQILASSMILPGGLAFHHAATLAGPFHSAAMLAHLLIVDLSTHVQHKLCVASSALEDSVEKGAVAHRHQGWAASTPWDTGTETELGLKGSWVGNAGISRSLSLSLSDSL